MDKIPLDRLLEGPGDNRVVLGTTRGHAYLVVGNLRFDGGIAAPPPHARRVF